MIGQVISHYRVLEKIGGGGMGIVFLAEDQKLGRRVALKFLSEAGNLNSASLERFKREARAASALNHPNICTIYEIDEDQGRPFIAMEFLEGQSLDRETQGSPVGIERLLDIAIQLSEGLDAAHRKGIVHRDIKPANLFLNRLGQLKILDFGLAKLTAEQNAVTIGPETMELTAAENLTSPGTAIGTIAYMSPEQTRGDDIDARSDLFSAGSVLYELSSGRLPFPGKTSALIFEAILNREPIPPRVINPSLPEALQRIIDRCLEKDRNVRYQSAADLRAELKRLKRDSTSGRHSTKTIASNQIASLPEESATRQSGVSVLTLAARKHTIGFGLGVLVTLLILSAAAFGIYALVHHPDRQPFQTFIQIPMTNSGDAGTSAISLDGKYLAYLRRESDGKRGVWIRQLSTNTNSQIVPPSDEVYAEFQFGPESNYIYFRVQAADKNLFDLYRVPFLGGTPQRLMRDVDSRPSFAPDGKSLSFLRQHSPTAEQSQILSVSTEGGQESVLVTGKKDDFYAAARSPDGKAVAFGRQRAADFQWDIKVLDLSVNHTRQLLALPDPTYEPVSITWLPSGRGFLLVYRRITDALQQIASISYPQGEFRKLTNDTSVYRGISLTADGKTLATNVIRSDFSLQVFPAHGTIDDSHGTSFGQAYWVDWLDDHHLLSFGQSNGLFLVDIPGSTRSELLHSDHIISYDGHNCGGRSLAFTGVDDRIPGASHIYDVDWHGANLRQLTPGDQSQYFRCTPDGVWVIYYDFADGSVKKIARSGGTPEILVPGSLRPGNQFDVSNNGKSVFLVLYSGGEATLTDLSVESGHLTKKFNLRADAGSLTVMPGGDSIAYTSKNLGVMNIWQQPVSGTAPSPLSKFVQGPGPAKSLHNFAWSPDGKQLALIRSTSSTDVVLLQDQPN